MTGELHEAIAKLWEDARPRIAARIDALEAAAARPDDLQAQERAAREAHTLVGTLGSFGRMEASETARTAEDALERRDHAALAAAAAALRAQVG
jgi:HPt (histidine-containing phosphotransfer) domain-containing protein